MLRNRHHDTLIAKFSFCATSHGDSTLSIRKNEAPVTFRLRTGRKHIRPYAVTCIHAFFDELSVGPLYCKVFPHYFKFHGRPKRSKSPFRRVFFPSSVILLFLFSFYNKLQNSTFGNSFDLYSKSLKIFRVHSSEHFRYSI